MDHASPRILPDDYRWNYGIMGKNLGINKEEAGKHPVINCTYLRLYTECIRRDGPAPTPFRICRLPNGAFCSIASRALSESNIPSDSIPSRGGIFLRAKLHVFPVIAALALILVLARHGPGDLLGELLQPDHRHLLGLHIPRRHRRHHHLRLGHRFPRR